VQADRLQAGDAETLSYDLSGWKSGAYTVEEDYSGSLESFTYYRDPELRQQCVFAVLDLAIGEALYQQAVSFRIAFPARRETLKYYVVAKRYSHAELALLQVTDKGGGEEPLTFLKTIAPDDRVARLLQEEEAAVVLFQSEQTVRRFQEGLQRIQLTGNGDLLVRHLPQPGADRPNGEIIVHISKR